MNVWLLYVLLSLSAPPIHQSVPPRFQKILRFAIYTFVVKTSAVDSVETATVAAYRGDLLLTRFTQPIEGTLTGAEVADLDGNRLPELYLYSVRQDGSMSREIHGWHFLPERLSTITPVQWMTPDSGYMGLDTLWTTKNSLCRSFPLYTITEKTARPTGTTRRICYRLRPAGQNFQLLPN